MAEIRRRPFLQESASGRFSAIAEGKVMDIFHTTNQNGCFFLCPEQVAAKISAKEDILTDCVYGFASLFPTATGLTRSFYAAFLERNASFVKQFLA